MVAVERCPEMNSFIVGEERFLEKDSLLRIVAADENG